jgi:hypothetical protein
MELKNISEERFDIGRAAILRAPHWDGSDDLFAAMEHIGTTEGPVEIEPNEEYSDLTIEVTGPAILKRYLSGESPSFDLGVFPDPEKMALFSPTGTASSGVTRRRLVRRTRSGSWPRSCSWPMTAPASSSRCPSPSRRRVPEGRGGADRGRAGTGGHVHPRLEGAVRPDGAPLRPRGRRQVAPHRSVQVLQDLDKPDGCQL